MKITTSYYPPPIPTRDCDWSAIDSDTYDGAPDSPNRHQVGYGATEAEAIADLRQMLEDNEALPWRGRFVTRHADATSRTVAAAKPTGSISDDGL